jgi:ATP/ADP translocase
VLLVLGYSVASAAATQLLYFIVWDRAAVRFPDAAHLAAFLGAFGALMNTVSIVFVVLVAGRLLRRFGVRLG